MKRLVFISLLLVAVTVSAQDTIRIMTYNIKAATMSSTYNLADYIKQWKPDLVALQEVDVNTARAAKHNPEGTNVVDGLGYYTDMLSAFSSSLPYKGGYYGVGVLSKYPFLSVESVALPQKSEAEPRSLIVCKLKIGDKDICFMSAHLCLKKDNRVMQMKTVEKIAKKAKCLTFVCGDMNSFVQDGEIKQYMKSFKDALPEDKNTFPSLVPDRKIDYVLYNHQKEVEVIDTQIDTIVPLSDHCCCIVDVVVK